MPNQKRPKILESLTNKSERERQLAQQKSHQNQKSPDIQKRLDAIKAAKTEAEASLMSNDKASLSLKVSKKSTDVDSSLLKDIQAGSKQNNLRPLISENQNKEEPKQEIVQPNEASTLKEIPNAVIVELTEAINLTQRNTSLTKYRDLKKSERGLLIREATQEESDEEGEDCYIIEFESEVFQSRLYPDKNKYQFPIPKRFVQNISDISQQQKNQLKKEKVEIEIEDLHNVYQKFGESLTSLGLLDYCNNFVKFIFESDLTELINQFIEVLKNEKSPHEKFNAEGFLQILDNKSWLKVENLDALLCDFINYDKEVLEWFKSIN